jgi:hypothetical protein
MKRVELKKFVNLVQIEGSFANIEITDIFGMAASYIVWSKLVPRHQPTQLRMGRFESCFGFDFRAAGECRCQTRKRMTKTANSNKRESNSCLL